MFSLLLSRARSGAPVPKRPTGIVWNNDAKDIVVEMYGDPLCPDCLAAWQPVMQMVTEYSKNVQFRLHLLPLPYHTWGFVVTKFAMGIKSISPAKACDFMNALYTGDQEKFENEPLAAKGQTEIIDFIADYASNLLSIEKTTLMEAYNSNELNARIEFKYAALHSVAGTPTFFVNGVQIDLDGESTINEWREIIDPLLN